MTRRARRTRLAGAGPELQTGTAMTTIERPGSMRTDYFHDPLAPAANLVAPSVLVAVRWHHGTLLLVRRCDTGGWELPGGAVEVGETAVEAAVRRPADDAGVHVEVTEFAGLFSAPGHVVRSSGGEVRQQLALLFRGRAHGGVPHGNQRTTS